MVIIPDNTDSVKCQIYLKKTAFNLNEWNILILSNAFYISNKYKISTFCHVKYKYNTNFMYKYIINLKYITTYNINSF